jgi:hypothetical protein
MATLALGSSVSLAELNRRENPDGTVADLIDAISTDNTGFFADALWIGCNNGTFHEGTRVASKPTGAVRNFNEGYPIEAGVTEKVIEPTEKLGTWSQIDVGLVEEAPNPAQFRMTEEALFLSGIMETHISHFFDSNRGTSPKQINGINNRADYNTLSSAQVYDNADGAASATANKTSLYVIQWGDKMVNMIFPRSGKTGSGNFPVKRTSLPMQAVADPLDSTKQLKVYNTEFEINFGIFIHDVRMVFRLANISTSNIDGSDDFSFNEKWLIQIFNQLRNGGKGAAIYVNRTLASQFMERANDKGNANWNATMEGDGPFARPVTRFWGIPVRVIDAITNDQATVT